MFDKSKANFREGLSQLESRFGPRATRNLDQRRQHCHTLTEFGLMAEPPDLVVFAHDEADVVDAVRICSQQRIPVIPFGVGTSLEGQVNAPMGGVCLDLSGLDRICSVSPEDFMATVQPGVTRQNLDSHLRDTGLFFPVDPGSHCTIGGMVSTRASGTNAVKYGTMRENTVSLRVVLANGTVISSGSAVRKSAAGYDLTRLFVGAEGTLGVITEICVRLAALPAAMIAGRVAFPDVASACNVVVDAQQMGLSLARIELLDAVQIEACNSYSGLGLPIAPTLFVDFHGSDTMVEESAREFSELAAARGGSSFDSAVDERSRKVLWNARHDGYWAARALRPGTVAISTDVCVPVSRLAETILAAQTNLAELELTAPIAGHVGDGNFHALLLIRPDDEDEASRAKRFLSQLVEKALAVGGTCTGEHGIGQNKKSYLATEFGPDAIGVMEAIKFAMDPLGIMNPGKIF